MKVNARAADPAHVVRHEIIHALRDARLWGTPHGLFTQGEWQALVRAARADTALRKAVETAYADQGATAQTEEMVAEMYADWARARDAAPPGLLGRAMERMQSFFRAMASACAAKGSWMPPPSCAASPMARLGTEDRTGRMAGARPVPKSGTWSTPPPRLSAIGSGIRRW